MLLNVERSLHQNQNQTIRMKPTRVVHSGETTEQVTHAEYGIYCIVSTHEAGRITNLSSTATIGTSIQV